jgi:hypothetical protein
MSTILKSAVVMPWEYSLAKRRKDCDCGKVIGQPLYMIIGNRPRVRKVSGLAAVIDCWKELVPCR